MSFPSISQFKNFFSKAENFPVGMAGIADVPDEVLTRILSYLDIASLLRCRRVCSYWQIIVDRDVWKMKIKRDHSLSLNETVHVNSTVTLWTDFYILNKKLKINLLKNNSGQDKFNNWKIINNGGNQWKVENPPAGANKLPSDPAQTFPEFHKNFCFATSYGFCSKEQSVDLIKEGFTPALLDVLQPPILISEWYAGRFDCGCQYKLKVTLLNKDLIVFDTFNHEALIEQWEGKEWNKVEHTFQNYGPGVRYVRFYHEGKDTQFWAGNYGSKMTGASVMLSLNAESSAKD